MITANNPHWPEFKRTLLLTEIEELRTRLEQPMDPLQTAEIRGRIAALRQIIEAVEKPSIEAAPRNYRT